MSSKPRLINPKRLPKGDVLVWWPLVKLDDEGNLTDKAAGGYWFISNHDGSDAWEEPEALNAIGQYFGDDMEYAKEPTHWRPLPRGPAKAAVAAALKGTST